MRFHDIPGETFSVRVKSTDGNSLETRFVGARSSIAVARVAPSETPAVFDLALSDSLISVAATSEAGGQRLNRELGLGRAMLAELSDPASDGSVDLRIAFFAGAMIDMGDLEIGVDEYVERGVNRVARRRVADVHAWLADRCTITLGGQIYFFVTAGPAIEDALQPQPDRLDRSAAAPPEPGEDAGAADTADTEFDDGSLGADGGRLRPRPTVANSFCITGKDVRFVATATSVGEASIHVATKLTARGADTDRAIRLARGDVRFLDWTRTGRIRMQAQAQLSALTTDESSYLRKWDEFGDLEGEILLSKAREIGALEFTRPRPERDGTVSVRIVAANPAALDALSDGRLTDLEAVTSTPEYLTDPGLTFSDFSRDLVRDLEAETLLDRLPADRGLQLQVERFDRESMTLYLKAEHLTGFDTLVMSMAGDSAQIRRRLQARRAIITGRSANPQLGVLIEEKGEVTSLRSPQKVKPLTAFVREKVFQDPPTAKQERAVEVALNTPDIAMIQGPPGTGKTTVIAAVLERLNEIATRGGQNLQGQVLLSGFQHDAVENMISRISLNGIPVPKFGKRSGALANDLSAFEKELEAWCARIASELRAANPQITDLEEEAAIKDLYRQYLRTPTRQLASTLVTRIAAVDVSVLGETLSRRAVGLAQRMSAEERVTREQGRHIAAAQRIRTRPESFADDGPDRASDALVDLEQVLSETQSTLLDRASVWRTARGTPPFLGELAALKRSLLVELTSPPVFRVEKHNDQVLSLADRAIKAIRSKGFSVSDQRTAALAEFLAELEHNPVGMVDAVSDFSYAFSATVQQSVNKEMQLRKGLPRLAGEGTLEYEYVIIDEAARVSPRDLMIPMSQGKRIILVGDHRQLPHVVDEEVAQRMEAGEKDANEAQWLKTSMFQYLFAERLKALEEKDGIQRRVTLDKQFRMHPQLGDFVSRTFYERFDPNERFASGRLAESFSHHLPGSANRAAIWLDVPAAAGAGKRAGTSWTRRAEADEIARRLRGWVESPEGRDLSYGVISFYRNQAELVRRELARQLGRTGEDERRIRVGTVDSFQGMEFDVVFLSVVRTLPPHWAPSERDPALQARRLFGHLCLSNRLNVSMSRQKKLLVVVGDSALVRNELAREFIPGLVDFYELTRRTGSVS